MTMPPESVLRDASLLVTGGTGAFGRAFVARALADGARRVVVFSRDEAKQAKAKAEVNDSRVRWMLGDVRDQQRLSDAMHGVDFCVHAAAMKRIEACESEPRESRKTNVDGTDNVARACIERGVNRAVYLSTDKAAAPSTVYGSHKLAAERSWCASNVYAAGTSTRFAATRYGNVTNSTGSVIPLWKYQSLSGFVTITDVRMTRFLMPMASAVDLVITALSDMRGGEVFVPKIQGARMVDLACVVAPGAEQRIVGIRPGEKLHEILIDAEEARRTYDCGAYFVIMSPNHSWSDAVREVGRPVPDGFTYVSNAEPLMDDSALAEVAA